MRVRVESATHSFRAQADGSFASSVCGFVGTVRGEQVTGSLNFKKHGGGYMGGFPGQAWSSRQCVCAHSTDKNLVMSL